MNQVFISASNQLGGVEAGFVAALTTATVAVVSGGAAAVAVVAVIAAKVPELRSYRVETETGSDAGAAAEPASIP